MEDSTRRAGKGIIVEIPRYGSSRHRRRAGRSADRLLSSWAIRAGLLVFIAQCIYVPWWQAGFIGSGGIPVPPRSVGYSLLWNPPYQASVDLTRLFIEIVVLAAAVALGYHFERRR